MKPTVLVLVGVMLALPAVAATGEKNVVVVKDGNTYTLRHEAEEPDPGLPQPDTEVQASFGADASDSTLNLQPSAETETVRFSPIAGRVSRTLRSLFAAFVALQVVGLVIIPLFLRRRRGGDIRKFTTESMLNDPDAPELKRRIEAAGDSPQRFVLRLRDGRKEIVSGELNNSRKVVVRIPGNPNPVRWDTRRQALAKALNS